MGWSFTVATIRGIDLKVHVTFVLILVWAAWYWGNQVGDALRGAIFGVVATLLLFLCVTLHEFGHAFQAKAYGIETEDITLLPIGGVARLSEIPREPRQEFRIAIAGPLVNVFIALILGIVAFLAVPGGLSGIGNLVDDMQDGTWRALIGYLLFANIWLVLFNLIPAFPMDGGRILRSVLAMRMDYRRATSIAVLAGQAIALLMGFIGFATGQYFLIMIAVFVWFGGSQEGRQQDVRSVLGQAKVRDVMTPRPLVLSADDQLERAIMLTLSSSQADFPVVDAGGRVSGLLSLDGLLKSLQQQGSTVRSAMTEGVTVARPDESIADAQERLAASAANAMPVISADGILVGLLTTADIAEAYRLLVIQEQLAQSGKQSRSAG